MSLTLLDKEKVLPLSIQAFQKRKEEGLKLSMVTCYDYTSAVILNASAVDCILVGDSGSMVQQGHPNTLSATVDMMAQFTGAVSRGAPHKLIIGDLPFCSYRKSRSHTVSAAEALMRAGAQAVKLEGAEGNLKAIRHLVDSGIPVMGHLGLTPQSIHTLGGYKVQGRVPAVAAKLIADAEALAQAGCFGLVLECVPVELAKEITECLSIPTIGIGAGPYTDGQVLVWHDLLGLSQTFKPKFLKTYLEGADLIRAALNEFDQEVKGKTYPDLKEHSYR